MSPSAGHRRALLALSLVAATFLSFSPVAGNGFVNLDDEVTITRNERLVDGLSLPALQWALTSSDASNWYPVTRATQLLDVELFGMRAGWHHLVSVAWHAAAAACLFLALAAATGATVRPFVAAALFAIHPLQVESVAWATERSMVLAGFFGALTLLAWVRYARDGRRRWYAAAAAALALGLASKPILVTFPVALLLFDAWPLGRFRGSGAAGTVRLVTEKLPLLGLAAAAGLAALRAAAASGALESIESLPLGLRLGNAALSCWAYLGKLVWPVHLAVIYPHPGSALDRTAAAVAGAALAVLSALVLALRRRRPSLAFGWFWFLLTLLPVSGLVQAGTQGMADRFAYFPLMGLATTAAWGGAAAAGHRLRRASAAFAAAVLLLLGVRTAVQAGYWRDSVTLFERTLRVAPRNPLAENGLGKGLLDAGRPAEAAARFREALRLVPDFRLARYNLAVALVREGRPEEAVAELRALLGRWPRDFESRYNLGTVLLQLGRPGEAAAELRAALAERPDQPDALYNLASALAAAGRTAEARAAAERLLAVDPGAADGRALIERLGGAGAAP